MARPLTICRRRWFRYVILSLGAVYFLAMYIIHSDLQLSGGRSRDNWDRLEIGADAAAPQRHQRSRDEDLQRVFDGMQLNERDKHLKVNSLGEQKELNVIAGREVLINPEASVNRMEAPVFKESWRNVSSSLDDVNIPVGCKDFEADDEFRFRPISSEVFVYSAFWDSRPNDFDNRENGSYIRIMAIIRSNARPELKCSFEVSNDRNGSSHTSRIRYYEMCENHGRIYGGFILSCSVPPAISGPTCSVKVAAVSGGVVVQTVRLRIRTIDPAPQRRDFAICVPPLFGTVNIARLVEFLEVSRILGAEHVTMYDFDLSSEVSAVLDHYSRERKFVSIIPWKLDRSIDEAIWYHAQLVSIQDCLYRTMASANYVAFNDIDEFIVPRSSLQWSRMLQVLDKPKRCAFQFKSAFFKPVPDESETRNNEELGIQTLNQFERTSNFDRIRTKCMVKAFSIFEKGIHHVSKPIWADLQVHPVETDVAFLHHYRVCLHGMGMNCGSYEQDTTMMRYRDKIVSAVNASNYSLRKALNL